MKGVEGNKEGDVAFRPNGMMRRRSNVPTRGNRLDALFLGASHGDSLYNVPCSYPPATADPAPTPSRCCSVLLVGTMARFLAPPSSGSRVCRRSCGWSTTSTAPTPARPRQRIFHTTRASPCTIMEQVGQSVSQSASQQASKPAT